MWMHGPFMGRFSFLMIFSLVFLIIFLLFVVRRFGRGGFRGGSGPRYGLHPQRPQSGSARDLLDQRYARGEIDDAQYLKMKATLAS